MDLLNQTLNSFSTLIFDEGVSLNLDIFEANLINITLLAGGLFYLLSGALSESLSERQQKILGSIQESKEKIQEATTTLTEAKEFVSSLPSLTQSIQKEAKQMAVQFKSSILTDGKTEIEHLKATTKTLIATIDAGVRKLFSNYVVTLILLRITVKLLHKLGSDLEQHQIFYKEISKLA
jgi:F0F1-type ATP synthase membrane subunit b/b'